MSNSLEYFSNSFEPSCMGFSFMSLFTSITTIFTYPLQGYTKVYNYYKSWKDARVQNDYIWYQQFKSWFTSRANYDNECINLGYYDGFISNARTDRNVFNSNYIYHEYKLDELKKQIVNLEEKRNLLQTEAIFIFTSKKEELLTKYKNMILNLRQYQQPQIENRITELKIEFKNQQVNLETILQKTTENLEQYQKERTHLLDKMHKLDSEKDRIQHLFDTTKKEYDAASIELQRYTAIIAEYNVKVKTLEDNLVNNEKILDEYQVDENKSRAETTKLRKEIVIVQDKLIRAETHQGVNEKELSAQLALFKKQQQESNITMTSQQDVIKDLEARLAKVRNDSHRQNNLLAESNKEHILQTEILLKRLFTETQNLLEKVYDVSD